MLSNFKGTLGILIALSGFFFILLHDWTGSTRNVCDSFIERIDREYRECMLGHPELRFPNTTWDLGPAKAIRDCYVFGAIPITVKNLDEDKKMILPKNQLAPCTFVTLGIGHDTTAEETIKKMLPNCAFHGADPVDEGNKEKYEKIGKFYQYAVSGGDVADSSILAGGKYLSRQKMKGRPLFAFLKEDVKESIIDYIFIDVEWAEYDMLKLLLSENAAKEGVTLCQVNIEVHVAQNDNQKDEFHRFIRSLLEEGFYVLTYDEMAAGHHRLFFYNLRSPICRERFFTPSPNSRHSSPLPIICHSQNIC